MSNIAWFRELNKEKVSLAGGKGASLGEMYNAGLPIPPGFVVTTLAYRKFFSQIAAKVYPVMKQLDIENNENLQSLAKDIQEVIIKTPMSEELQHEIIEAYEALTPGHNTQDMISSKEESFVAVRSSANAEDSAEASFAGQNATYLNIKGTKKLLAAVKACWASLFTARSIYYRTKNNFAHDKVFIAVVVQQMVNSEKAGVMFSVNPVSQNQNEIMIESAYGLGESVVSGAITPDEYVVNKDSEEITKRNISTKTWMFTKDSEKGETVKVDVAKEMQSKESLNEHEIRVLTQLAKKIEDHYGKPQDMEYAIEKERIYIVQSRPITTLNKQPEVKEQPKQEVKEEHVEQEQTVRAPTTGELLVKGLSASPGIGSGKAKIVRNPDELNKIQQGDVLVAEMTNPDMVPGMKRASAIVTDAGGSTCFPAETIILTNKGFKTIKEIYRDYSDIFIPSLNRETLKIEWKKVIASMKREAKIMEVNISQTGRMRNNLLRLTPDHKMITFDNRKLISKKIEDIVKEKKLILVAQKIPNFIESTELEKKKAYLLGSILSDGYISLTKRRGSVQFIQKLIPEKKEFISTVAKYMNEVYNTKDPSIYEKNGCGVIRGKQIVGSANNYSWFSKEIATDMVLQKETLLENMLLADEEVLFNFLAGFIDGDGTYNYGSNRINIYCSKNNLLKAIIVACLRLGIVPQVTENRTIHNIQIVEKIEEILQYTKRVKGNYNRICHGVRFFSAKQLLGDIGADVNVGGKILPYVDNNLIIDSDKISKKIIHLSDESSKKELSRILDSDLRMLRVNSNGSKGKVDVFNITVQDNHNYVVFTNKLTPIVVENCHAAIVSREMGIPCVVGTEKATQIIKENQEITVDGTKGEVYSGLTKVEPKKEEVVQTIHHEPIDTVTEIKVLMDLPDFAEKAAKTGADGVGLLRCEMMMAESGKHPIYLIKNGRKQELYDIVYNGVKKVVSAFEGKPVWYRTSDFRTDEYKNLEGGEHEPEESNPMLGFHGIRRGLEEKELLKTEFEALKKLHDEGHHIGIMLPMVTHLSQVHQAKKMLEDIGGGDIEFGIMIETPAAVQIIEDLCKEGIDFISFGTNDLTQFTLACDRNNAHVQNLYDEMHPAVLNQIRHVVKTCRKFDVQTSICGQAGSRPEMAKFLVEIGIDSISANADAVEQIRHTVAREEKSLLLNIVRKRLEQKEKRRKK